MPRAEAIHDLPAILSNLTGLTLPDFLVKLFHGPGVDAHHTFPVLRWWRLRWDLWNSQSCFAKRGFEMAISGPMR